MWNLAKPPIDNETLDEWTRLSTDIAKVAILAIPVMLYSDSSVAMKLFNFIFLAFGAYFSLYLGRLFKRMKTRRQ